MCNYLFIILSSVFYLSAISQDTIPAGMVIKSLNTKDPNYFCEKTFDGILIKEGFRKNDSVYGEMHLYEQGKLITVLNFINEELNGAYFAYFFPNGKLYLSGSHKNGKKEGIWKEYDLEGKLISKKKYKNDEQIE